jgi:hypothetical protein
LATLADGSAIKRSSKPCPYYVVETNSNEPLIKDEYIVRLRENYTVEQHFQFLGHSISQYADKFVDMRSIKSYSIRINEKMMHESMSYIPRYFQILTAHLRRSL